ncbi:Cytochrome c oxidase subunit 2 [Paraconexibacter sp. AEG42_29]|uniref:Cytochrome c oxidase subunit 2 n=1 Tax=Paraconexibacter sp. AEG42_29 TaxID=2997339 RepID=A0AAU7AY87_9ACTN
MAVDPRARTSNRTIGQMVVVGVIASAIGVAWGLYIDWFPIQGSSQAKKIDELWDVLLIIAVPVFVMVVVVILFAVRDYRQRPGEELLDGPNVHGSTRLEIIWTTIPAVVIFVLVGYAATILSDIEEAPANAAQELKIDVTGEQFAWTFKYKGADGKDVNTTRLYLPKGRSVKFNVRSKDVIHDFWIPEMRMKVDAVPGIVTSYRITPIREGNYPVVCAELCGLGHSVMRQTAYVQSADKFDAWLAKQSAPAPAAAPAEGGGAAPAAAIDAKKLFTDGNGESIACGSCHQLADAGTPAGGVGPNLDMVLAGQSADMIKESIVEPEKVATKGFPPGVMPPNYGETLKPEELDALVEYLVTSTKK